MRTLAASILVLLLACHGKQPSAAEKEIAKATEACKNGDGPSCLVAAMLLDPMKKDELQQAIALWTRGCELGHGPCCAQLGTVAEFGMTTGGAKPDAYTANHYYLLACKRGDTQTCKRLGIDY